MSDSEIAQLPQSRATNDANRTHRLAKLDLTVLTLSGVSLFISCLIISPNKHFWNDELFTYFLLAEPTFSGMWAAFNDKINNTPPLYFVLGWLWVQPFGTSELSLRLFSSLGMFVGLVLAWITIRRTHGFWPTCMGVLVVFLTSTVVLEQNSEARMYGLFLALCTGAVYQFTVLNAHERIKPMHLFWLFVLHGAIVNTHLFGPFYSGMLLIAYLAVDLHRQRWRPGISAAIVAGWATFLIYLPAFLIQSDAGNPRAWMPIPTVGDMLGLLGLSSASFVDVRFLVALLFILMLLFVVRGRTLTRQLEGQERNIMYVAFGLMSVVLVTFAFSLVIKPIVWDRYVIPTILGYSILIAHLTSLHQRASALESSERVAKVLSTLALASMLVAILANPIIYALKYPHSITPGVGDFELGYDHLPMVVQAQDKFLPRYFYDPRPERYVFVLDEEASMSSSSGSFGVQEFKHMDAYKRQFPEGVGRQIWRSEEFLASVDSFLVHDYSEWNRSCPEHVVGLRYAREWVDMHCPQWVEMRLLPSPEWRVEDLGRVHGNAILLVTRTLSAS